MVMFKIFKNEKLEDVKKNILKYRYRYLFKIDEFDEFSVWKTDSPNVPADREISEQELEQLRKQREASVT